MTTQPTDIPEAPLEIAPQAQLEIARKQYFGRGITETEEAVLVAALAEHRTIWGPFSKQPAKPDQPQKLWPSVPCSPYFERRGLPGDGLLPSDADTKLANLHQDCIQDIAKTVNSYQEDCLKSVAQVLQGSRVYDVARGVLQGILSGQHIFLYGTAGVGKTTVVKNLCDIMDITWTRLDGQSDMADIHLMGSFLPTPAEDGRSVTLSFRPGPLLEAGNFVLLIDELPRIPTAVSNLLLQPMAERSMAFADLIVGGSRHVQLSPGFTIIGTGNPFHFGGMAQKNEAVFDRFGMGFDMPHPGNSDRLAMLRKKQGNPEKHPFSKRLIADGSPLTLADIRVACQQVKISQENLEHIIAISSLVSPAEYQRQVQWDDAFGLVRNAMTPTVRGRALDDEEARKLWSKFHLESFASLVDEVVQEGSNPRGEEMMAQVARICALSDGRLKVKKSDIATAASRCLRFRLKPHSSMEPYVPEIIRVAAAVQLQDPSLILGQSLSEETWKRLNIHPDSSREAAETFGVLFGQDPAGLANLPKFRHRSKLR